MFRRSHPRRALESLPRHAIPSSWLQYGLRTSRRVLLVVGVAVLGGPLAYIVLPQPVAAQTGAVQQHVVLVRSWAASAPLIAPPAAFVGGAVQAGDLLSDPEGITSIGTSPAAGGELIGWPVSDHTPSTGFGYRSDPFTHRQRWHDGVDLGQPCGSPAVASLDGTVAYAGWAGGYGNRVILRHADRDGHTFATTYNHMARIEVSVGQTVAQGDVVGRVGSTGRSTACHMHFEVILDGSYVDPMRFLTGDTSKAGLSRRVGSFMPDGMPSPGATSTSNVTSTHTRPATHTPTPSPTTPAPTTPAPTTPAPTTPVPTTPSPTSPSPSGPGTATPGNGTPATSPVPTSAAAAVTSRSQGSTPAASTAHPASTSVTGATTASAQTPLGVSTDAVSASR